MAKIRDWSNTRVWEDPDPEETARRNWVGSWHKGNGVFRQRCRACPEVHDTEPGQGPVERYFGIGPHEYKIHGLDVPGINVGLLP